METYVSILRGINVSGQKKVNMKELKALYEELGFTQVRTYIQSGNVVFESSPAKPQDLAKQIEEKIADKYKFDVPIIIRDAEEWENTRKANPFLAKDNSQLDKLHVTFLSEEPTQAHLDKVATYRYEPDEFIIVGKDVYVYCPNGYGNTKLNNTFFENKLKVTATTRNWKTVNELANLIKNTPYN